MWEVRVVKWGAEFTWQSNYFPRMFRYKREAERLLQLMRERGGDGAMFKMGTRAKSARQIAAESVGLTKVKGALGGTYYE